MEYGLPKSVEIDGVQFAIRYDYRVILDIFEMMNDPDLSDEDRALAMLQMFYLDFEDLTDYDAAINECIKFINGQKAAKFGKLVPRFSYYCSAHQPCAWP